MRSTFKCLLLLAVVCVFQSCGGSSSDSGGGSSASSANACGSIGLGTRVINGQTCRGLATSSVVRIAAVLSDGSRTIPFPICSGTMISSDDVLTATHCFQNSEFFGLPVVDYGILVGDSGSLVYYGARALEIAPAYSVSNDRLFNDAAVLKLNQSPGLPVVPVLLSRSPQVGNEVFVYGYGREEEGEAESVQDIFDDALTLVGGAMTIENITENHIFVFFSGSGTNVCNGDSGGPMVQVVDGVPTVIGIVSQGTAPGCSSGDVTTFTNVQSTTILNWLVDVVPDAAAF